MHSPYALKLGNMHETTKLPTSPPVTDQNDVSAPCFFPDNDNGFDMGSELRHVDTRIGFEHILSNTTGHEGLQGVVRKPS